MSEILLELKNISCGYGKEFVMNNISCQFKSGKITGIIGPNGSGKTTILRAATAVLKPQKGSIELNGKDIRTISLLERAKTIAVVSQESNFFFDMNVLEYVLIGRIPHKKTAWFPDSKNDITRAEKTLEKCGVANFAKRMLGELSGGERQLVHIARALVQEPSILFLDEPTNHLDMAHQQQVMILTKKLAEESNLAIVVVLHDLNLAARFCNTLYLVHQGRIRSSGSPEEILKPETLNEVYSAKIAICNDPINNKPLIFSPL